MNRESNLLKNKRRKNIIKNREDTTIQTNVAVFRVGDLNDPLRRLKIERNAQQLYLTGLAVICPTTTCNVIIVEGGSKALKKFTKLLMNRIDWKPPAHFTAENKDSDQPSSSAPSADGDDEEEEGDDSRKKGQGCSKVWTGTVTRASLKNFRYEHCRSDLMARKYLADRGIAHYWDMALNHQDPNDVS